MRIRICDKIILGVFFSLFIIAEYTHSVETQSENDRNALVDIAKDIDTDYVLNWNTPWTAPDKTNPGDGGDWDYVSWKNGHVVKISTLRMLGLTGATTAFRRLPCLSSVQLPSNKIDISSFENMPQLRELWLGTNNLDEREHPLEMPGIISLSLGVKKLSKLKIFENLITLQDLRMGYNNIHDLTPLKNLHELRILSLTKSAIQDISPLRDLCELYYLILDENAIQDISPLKSLPNLSHLHLRNNEITDISALNEYRKLYSAHFEKNKITSIPLLTCLTSLTYLDLSDNQVTDISLLSTVSEKAVVVLTGNRLRLSQLYDSPYRDKMILGPQNNVHLDGFDDTVFRGKKYSLKSEFMLGETRTDFTILRQDGSVADNGVDYEIDKEGNIEFLSLGIYQIKMSNEKIKRFRENEIPDHIAENEQIVAITNLFDVK